MGGREEEDDEGELKMQGGKRCLEFRYLGSTVQADGDSEIEVTKRTAAGWNSWRKVSGVLYDRKAPLSVKGKLLSHWGGQDPVDEEEKDYLAKNMSIYDDCALNVDLHSRALQLNKRLTKSTQLKIAIGHRL